MPINDKNLTTTLRSLEPMHEDYYNNAQSQKMLPLFSIPFSHVVLSVIHILLKIGQGNFNCILKIYKMRKDHGLILKSFYACLEINDINVQAWY